MTLYLRHLRHEQRQNTSNNTYVTCCGAEGHTKYAPAKRTHKAAASQFGQVKLQLKSETLKKVVLSNSSGHSQVSGESSQLCTTSTCFWPTLQLGGKQTVVSTATSQVFPLHRSAKQGGCSRAGSLQNSSRPSQASGAATPTQAQIAPDKHWIASRAARDNAAVPSLPS